jgi:hypothetical protein
MRRVSMLLVLVLTAPPAFAQEKPTPSSDEHRGAMFWSGILLGAPASRRRCRRHGRPRRRDQHRQRAGWHYQACVAQQRDPYATNNCDALKGKNRALLWTGVRRRARRRAHDRRRAHARRLSPDSSVCSTPSVLNVASAEGGCDGVSRSPSRGPGIDGPRVVPGRGVGAPRPERSSARSSTRAAPCCQA